MSLEWKPFADGANRKREIVYQGRDISRAYFAPYFVTFSQHPRLFVQISALGLRAIIPLHPVWQNHFLSYLAVLQELSFCAFSYLIRHVNLPLMISPGELV